MEMVIIMCPLDFNSNLIRNDKNIFKGNKTTSTIQHDHILEQLQQPLVTTRSWLSIT